MPSTVTWRSAIPSRSADCAFGRARLISSTTRMFAKIGPGWNSKTRCSGLQTESPVTSVGCRSGVHWIRPGTVPSIEAASERASIVFAVPGTSSKSTCPRQTSAATTSAICSRFPRTTCSTLSQTRSTVAKAAAKPSGVSLRDTPCILFRRHSGARAACRAGRTRRGRTTARAERPRARCRPSATRPARRARRERHGRRRRAADSSKALPPVADANCLTELA